MRVPLVSVVVPVFNDSGRLPLCLDALDRQHPETVSYEVVVVDNGSDARHDIPGIVSRFRTALYVSEPTPTSYAARNAGIRHARGLVIAFTDADCVPAEDWIEAGYRRIVAESKIGLVAGRIDVTVGRPATAVELFDRVIAFPQEQCLRDRQFGATANLFTTRAVLDKVGQFDAGLTSGGDIDWGQRVAAAGFGQVYAANVVVFHPARRTFAQVHRRMTRLAGGAYAMTCERGGFLARQRAFVGLLLPDLMPPVTFALSIRRHPDLRGWRERAKVVAVMMFVRSVSAWAKIRLKCGAAKARE